MRTGLSVVAANAAASIVQPHRPHGEARGMTARILASIRALAVELRARHRRRAAARDLCAALHGLDDRTLRDLGFHRDEIASVAAEIGGDAPPTRVRTMRDGFAHPG
jgi:uncharacterized protein YjiS (DUF1127 family)